MIDRFKQAYKTIPKSLFEAAEHKWNLREQPEHDWFIDFRSYKERTIRLPASHLSPDKLLSISPSMSSLIGKSKTKKPKFLYWFKNEWNGESINLDKQADLLVDGLLFYFHMFYFHHRPAPFKKTKEN